MTKILSGHSTKLFHNPHSTPDAPYGERQSQFINEEGIAAARREIRTWPSYEPTPLVDLAGMAREAGIARIWYKDESRRLGLESFKSLGASYAVLRVLQREIARHTGKDAVSATAIIQGEYRDIVSNITVACATDGNHGRSLAWGAQMFGCSCVIYIHALVSEARLEAMTEFGAEVVRVTGNYDDSLREVVKQAELNGWLIVADSGYRGYMDIPCDVMHGYSVGFEEILEQLPPGELPTHTFIQAGCGGLAGAVCALFWQRWEGNRPRFIIVEPENAACLYESARAGEPAVVEGALDTIMAGLACGEVSLVAWEILDPGADDFMVIADEAAVECMRLLANGVGGDTPIVAGESAVSGFAALLCALADSEVAAALGLDVNSRVLLLGTEGATDPELYRDIVGRSAEQVIGSRTGAVVLGDGE